jgi:phage-related minor tail protein
MALPPLVHRFLKDTSSLLDHVYRTSPMLKAAPGEYLDFSSAERDEKPKAQAAKLRMDAISDKQKKRYRDRVRQLQLQLNKRTEQHPSLVNPMADVRYDDTFEKGIQWLDSLAGDRIEQREYVAEFSDDVWKSAARKGGDVS